MDCMPSLLHLHNTLSGQIEPFTPRVSGKAFVYICGITPYDYCHMGHARTLVSFDILRRWMMHTGLEVTYVQNVTDIDDKIIRRALENKKKNIEPSSPLALSSLFDTCSREDMTTLGILLPTHMPRISEHIPQTISLISKIISNNHAYITSSGVYFSISSFSNYGKLSGQTLDKLKAGARVEVDEEKKNPEDFALWKLDDGKGCTHAPSTGVCALCATCDSPWGRGRPGWHIECSAMSLHLSGGHSLDLHGGARDLIFPHHENEIAQSEGSGVTPFSRHWTHTGFLTVNGEKMAKSLGNFITIRDGLKKWDGTTMRLFFALTHYRSPIDFSESALNAAKNTLDNVRRSLSLMEGEGAAAADEASERSLNASVDGKLISFASYMDNDLDTPQALSELFEASKLVARARAENKCAKNVLETNAKKVSDAFGLLGIEIVQKQVKSTDAGTAAASSPAMSKEAIEQLITDRETARKAKDYAAADTIRKKLAASGVLLEDSKDGVKWRQV